VGQVTVIATPAQRAIAVALAERADRPRTWPGLDRRAPPPFRLVVVGDSADLARFSRGLAPGWGAGVAFPAGRTIVVRADLPDLERTLQHELAHLVLRADVRDGLPLWFEEGYASLAAGELGRLEGLEINLAVATGKVPSFAVLDGMLRGSSASADLGYALAASAVAEIARHPAPGGLDRLLERMRGGAPFGEALESATGRSPDQFEEYWQQSLRHRYNLLNWLVAGGLWAVIGAFLGLAVVMRRRADRPRRAALDVGWRLPPPPVSPEEDTSLPDPVDRAPDMQ
jgi:hypothetical protein